MSFGVAEVGGAPEGVGGTNWNPSPAPSYEGYDTGQWETSPDAPQYEGVYDYPEQEGYTPTFDFGQGALYSMNEAGYKTPENYGAGMAPAGTTPASTAPAEAQGFWGSRAQKVMSFFANMNPVTSIINAGAKAINSQDPVKATIQALLSRFGGDLGQLANAGYTVGTSKNPTQTAVGMGGAAVGGQLGGNIAGNPGAQLGADVMGNAAFAGADPAMAKLSNLDKIAPGESGGIPTRMAGTSGGGAPGRNWTDTAMSLASGIYGMRQVNAQRDLAMSAAVPARAAGAEMQRVMSGDFTGDAGFIAAQKAAARAGSQQPGGFAAQAAAQAALKYQNDRISTLAGASGSGSGYSNALGGLNSANGLASASLGSMGFGVSSGQSMPPWLQSYLVKNGMGGTPNA